MLDSPRCAEVIEDTLDEPALFWLYRAAIRLKHGASSPNYVSDSDV
jgi:hypothetical protein